MFFSVIVTYFPNEDILSSLVGQLREAGCTVFIYDNSPRPSNFDTFIDPKVKVLGKNGNSGLAKAFNECVSYIEHGFSDPEAILFFDQDAKVDSKQVKTLLRDYKELKKRNVPFGVLGASALRDNGQSYNLRKLDTEQSSSGFEDIAFQSWFVMSSFSIIPFSTFKKVGYFDERLFIDLVDSDFCFRCTRKELACLTSKSSYFHHEVGLKDFTVFGRPLFAISSPIRNYYQTRNVILVGKFYMGRGYIVKVLPKRLIQIILSGIKCKDLVKRIRFCTRGIIDGFKGKYGMFD